MPQLSATHYYLPAFVVFVLVLAAVCLSDLGVSLYSTSIITSRIHGSSSEDGNGEFGSSNRNKTISTITATTTTTTPTLYPPTPKKASQPVAKEYDNYWLVASSQREVLVTIIPKVMCSSIRTAMNAIECDPDSPKYNNRCAEARESPILRKVYKTFSNFTRVVFYRDPIERALSTYYNSETNRYIFVNGCETWKNCTFDYWVQQLAPYQHVTKRKHQGKRRNEHFMKQSVISQPQKMHYHYRLRMTNKDHTDFFFEQLLKTKPQSVNQSSNSKSKTKTNSTSSGTAMDETKAYIAKKFEQVSHEALSRLLVIYNDDFELWQAMVESAPRGPKEYTMYDYYKEHLEEELRPKVERIKKEMVKGGK
ncbi:MAG: hypothetical protein SGILL_000777 [Bacillariaceae sp.]